MAEEFTKDQRSSSLPQKCLETSKSSQMEKDNYPSLKPNIAPQNGWLEV